jgi:small subunit ribosomal protein S20
VKSATKTAVKKANAAILSGDINAAREAVREAIVTLDKAASKGVLHANNSARHKSRLLIKYNAAVAVLQSPDAEGKAAEAGKPTAKKAAPKKTPAPKKATAKKTGSTTSTPTRGLAIPRGLFPFSLRARSPATS